jgi:hypothetical protein
MFIDIEAALPRTTVLVPESEETGTAGAAHVAVVAFQVVPAGQLNVTLVQFPQLFPSLDSLMVPELALLILSAQARTWKVAGPVGVYE